VIFPGKHIRNVCDTTNADLRHYIPGLAHRSRCFYRSFETFLAMPEVFVDGYNAFGIAKLRHRVPVVHKSLDHAKHLHKYRDPRFSVIDFL